MLRPFALRGADALQCPRFLGLVNADEWEDSVSPVHWQMRARGFPSAALSRRTQLQPGAGRDIERVWRWV
jgi:hypothetical protein